MRLRHQYLLGYKPENASRDDKWRKVTGRTVGGEGRPYLYAYTKKATSRRHNNSAA